MALDIFTALKGGSWAVIQTECCVFIPDKSANGSSLSNHIRAQMNTFEWSDLQFRGINKSIIWIMGLLMEKNIYITYFGNYCLNLCFFLHKPLLLLWRLFQDRQIATKWSTPMLMKPLADLSSTLQKRGACETELAESALKGGVLGEVFERT